MNLSSSNQSLSYQADFPYRLDLPSSTASTEKVPYLINKPWFQSVMLGMITGGIAAVAKLPPKKVFVCGLLGANIIHLTRHGRRLASKRKTPTDNSLSSITTLVLSTQPQDIHSSNSIKNQIKISRSQPILGNTKKNLADNHLKLLAVIPGIVTGTMLAVSLKREPLPKRIVICSLAGISMIWLAHKLITLRLEQATRTQVPTKRAPEMTINEALAFLNVPQENANDIEFIKAKYETLKKAATPKKNLGQSQVGLGIAELLQKIETAYMLLRTQAGSA